MHQMGPRGARFFVPPNLDPIDRNYDPLIWRTAGLLGHAMALALEEDGRTGVLQNALYDYYWPGYEDSAPLGHNTVTPADRSGQRARGLADHGARADQLHGRPRLSRSPAVDDVSRIPGPAATGRLRDIVDYDLSAARGLLGAAARYRGELLRNFYGWARRQVELGGKGGPFAYIIPPDQFDPHAARKLEAAADRWRGRSSPHARAVPRRRDGLSAGHRHHPDGAALSRLRQDAARSAELSRSPSAAGRPPDRPYDVAGWTLPLQMNVKVDRIDQYFEPPATTRLDRATMPPAKVWGDVRKPVVSTSSTGAATAPSIAINRLLKTGARVVVD